MLRSESAARTLSVVLLLWPVMLAAPCSADQSATLRLTAPFDHAQGPRAKSRGQGGERSRTAAGHLAQGSKPAAAGQSKSVAIPLVPAADWQLAESHQLPLEAIREWGGDPAVDREYGAKSLEHRAYQLRNKSAEALVEETTDPSSAYGLFTFYQAGDMGPLKGLQLAASDSRQCVMARGRYFIRVSLSVPPAPQISDVELRALLILIGSTPDSTSAQASLPAAMPATGLLPGSEKYLLGPEATRRVLPEVPTDLLGFGQGAEVQIGGYAAGRGSATVVAITYPTPQIARTRFAILSTALALNQDRGAGSNYGKQHGSFVFCVLHPDSASAAAKLMDHFDVSESVSWDQKYPGNENIWMQVVKLVLANFALVAILVGFCVIGGVLLFLSRRAAAKWFPQSSWGHPEEGVIIKLNLS